MLAPSPCELGVGRSPGGRRLLDGLLALALAPTCATCGILLDRPTRGPVCDGCWEAIRPYTAPLCAACGAPVPSWRLLEARPGCAGLPRGVTRARCLGEYDGALRAIIHALKYGGRRSLAPRLAALMRRRGADVLDGADAAVPVPLHRGRRRQRGFNQAADLAKGLGLPVVRALRRRWPTPSQATLTAAARRANVRDAFALTRAARRGALHGRTMVIVDDVWTTGATLEACARTLERAGVADLRVLTIARVTRRLRP